MTLIRSATLGMFCMASALSILSGGPVGAHAMPPHMPAPADTGPAAPDRKPYEMVAFAKIKPGQVVIDYLPGKGYFTRVFSAAVGNRGKVYAATPQFYIDRLKGRPLPPAVSTESGFSNVSEIVSGDETLNAPVPVDLVWTSQNYHDVHNWTGATGVAALNKAAFMALKPGGLYVVLDHAGVAGLDADGMAKLHRIDEALVKQEVLAAGFIFDGESQELRNPADPRSANVYDPSIRGRTDQFILRFRKPR